MSEERKTVKQRRQFGWRRDGKHVDILEENLPLHKEKKSPILTPCPKKHQRWEDHFMMRSSNRAASLWLALTLVTLNLFLLDFVPKMIVPELMTQSNLLSISGFKVPDTIVFRDAMPTMILRPGDINALGMSSFYQGLDKKPVGIFFERGPDYGKLKFNARAKFDSPIVINPLDYHHAEIYRDYILETSGAATSTESDHSDPESDRVDIEEQCRRVSWTGYSYPSCNQLHELLIERVFDTHGLHQAYNVSYLNSGSYREAWRFKRDEDHVVVKRLKMTTSSGYNAENMYRVHKEAIRLERLLPSPKVVNIYGHCGTTILSEAMASDVKNFIIPGNGKIPQPELDKLDNVYPQNNLTTSEKLQIALDMAEALAAMHGYEGGCMTLADTHIEEFLIAPDGTVKLNDFNLAKEPEWDEKNGKYCVRYSTYGKVHRSPEEYSGKKSDESVDTYAYGNMIYSTLTGLWPFYHEQAIRVPGDEIRKMIILGRRPYVDPRYRTRSFIERKLVEVMEQCWAQDRKKRPSMFYVVSFLRDVKRRAARKGEFQKSNLIKIEF